MRETSPPTVMIAVGNEDTRYVLKLWLESEGYRVVEAANGQEAVELTRGERPDLILMSERMPRVGGLEAAQRIREQVKQCLFPIVCMSTYPTQEARARALAGGFDEVIPEPLDFGSLGSLLGSLLPESAAPPRGRAAKGGPEPPLAAVSSATYSLFGYSYSDIGTGPASPLLVPPVVFHHRPEQGDY